MTYDDFTQAWASRTGGDVVGTCRPATEAMVAAFPELERVCGLVYMVDPPDGDTSGWTHWWCVDESGSIVDPTRSQFPCSELTYQAATGAPTGRCPNCAGLCYRNRALCSDACESQFAASIYRDMQR